MVEALHLADKYVDRISGGEFRLVNLAAVLAQETPVILLDEPASSLDYGNAVHLWRVLSQLAAGEDRDSHHPQNSMAAGYFNRILLLSRGRPVVFGEPGDVFSGDDILSDVYRTPLKMIRNSHGKGWVVCPGEKE